ncbi:unnamed protein product, partial [Amoebophrya sp. A120]|eukprot:GSA120T00015324001.1
MYPFEKRVLDVATFVLSKLVPRLHSAGGKNAAACCCAVVWRDGFFQDSAPMYDMGQSFEA